MLQCGIYRHYKHGYYQLLGIGQHTETTELMVVYVSLTPSLPNRPGPRLRIRPLNGPDGWLTPPGGHKERFTYVGLELPSS